MFNNVFHDKVNILLEKKQLYLFIDNKQNNHTAVLNWGGGSVPVNANHPAVLPSAHSCE